MFTAGMFRVKKVYWSAPRIASVDGASGKEARRRIELITADVEVGRVYEGRVARLMDFGAFVTILPGKDGLVHISQISNERVEKVSDKLSEGDIVKVKVLEVDRQGRVRLSSCAEISLSHAVVQALVEPGRQKT